MKVDKKILDMYVEKGLVTCQKHPEFDFSIYSYSKSCHEFDEVTRACRGLIVNWHGDVIARPFDKFFNREEVPNEVPKNVPFTAYNKLDGSLGIMYEGTAIGDYRIATRGSFMSEQAIEGTKMLREKINDIRPMYGLTYLFEIIYPENRIVVDYKGERKLVFLGARNIETGEVFLPDDEMCASVANYFECAEEIRDFEIPRDNAEGVVLYFENGFMCKVKYEEYVRLHRLITGITARSIWDLLRTGKGTKELCDRVPEEFLGWVKKTSDDLMMRYTVSYIHVTMLFEDLFNADRKAFAMAVMNNENAKKFSGELFRLYDIKPIDDLLWKKLKPSAEKAFREDL